MAAVATNSSTFPLFSSLPPELRDQIWRDALPNEIGPALYFYRKGCWCPRNLTSSDEEYDPKDDEVDLYFDFRHDLLDAVQFEVSLWFVNREARRIALAWVREHGIEIRAREDRRSPVFVCPFNPVRDVLYIAVDECNEFLYEPDDRCFQPDMVEKYIHSGAVNITRIVMPEALFQGEGEVAAALAELMDRYFSLLQGLYILVDTPLDLQPVKDGMKMQPRWELKNMEGGAFFWNHDHGRFDFHGSEHLIDKALYKLMEEINKRLGEELVKNSIRSFEAEGMQDMDPDLRLELERESDKRWGYNEHTQQLTIVTSTEKEAVVLSYHSGSDSTVLLN
ncbi:MAG: hypothetical protein Q9187_001333 [Circinaria calcarea]